MGHLLQLLQRLHSDGSGQDVGEYALIATFIGLASFAFLGPIGTQVSKYWSNLNATLT